jgi:hypothetical protein
MTYRLLSDVVEGIGAGVDNLTLNLVCPSTVVSQTARSSSNITLCHCESLAVVERLDSSECVRFSVKEVGKLHQKLATITRSDLAPVTLKGLAGSCNSNVDILLAGLVDRADNLP